MRSPPTIRACGSRRSPTSTTTRSCSATVPDRRAWWPRSNARSPDVRFECEHVFVPYVELHAHSAFSFLDGASLPGELAAAAVELGYEAMALTDHNGVSGSMEFAVAAAPLGLRAIHGVEIDVLDPTGQPVPGRAPDVLTRHVTLLVESSLGGRNLCRIITRAHVHDRDPR